MGIVKGRVTKVTVAKNTTSLPGRGEFSKHNITVQSDSGESLIIQKLAKVGNTGQELVGRLVQVTYTERELTNEETGEAFKTRSTDSKGFILLDEDGSPSYKPGQKTSGGVSHAPKTSSTSTVKSAGYNSEGARVGMIIKGAVDLATARDTLDMKGLRQAAVDLLVLTKEVETDSITAPVVSVTPKAKEAAAKTAPNLVDDEEDPFGDV